MPKPCSICHHPERKAIEKALLDTEAGHRKVAKRFGISASALFRHRQNHLPKLIARALAVKPTPVHREKAHDPATDEHAIEIARHHQIVEAEKDHHALDVTQQLKAINAACLEVLRQARTDGKHSILLRAVDRIAKQIEIQAKLLGQIDERTTVNVAVLPEWHGLRQVVLDALRPYPEARQAVAEALREMRP